MTQAYTSVPLLEIEGEPAPEELMDDILQLTVEESLHLPGMFTLVLRNSAFPGQEKEQVWQHEKKFQMGTTLKIGFRSSPTESEEFQTDEEGYVLKAEVTAIETHFTEGSQAPIIIRGYDVSHLLYRGRFNRSFQNMTDSDVVKNIIQELGLETETIESTSPTHDYIFQENQTNMEFLRQRAARNGFEFFVQDGKLSFRAPSSDSTLKMEWLKELTSFQVRVSSAEQVESVEVRGWDYQNKQAIVATQSSGKTLTENEYGEGKKTSTAFKGKPNSPKLIVVDQPVFKSKEAENMAKALFNELAGQFVQADAKAQGNPTIRPGRVVELEGLSKYSGKYYIAETRHIFSERLYMTEFSVRGLRNSDLLTLLAPTQHRPPGQSPLVGTVTNNNDPERLGRVRVKLPTLTEEHESNWARVVSVGAGADRGFDCLPEVDDEVLVAFEHGDIHRPYVIGNVWNGVDAPPEKVDDSVVDNKVRLRTMKTRTGHQLQFVEEDKGSSKKGVYVDSVYGHQVHLNDSEQKTEIKTKGEQQILMEDQGNKITISSQRGSIDLKAPQKITLTVGASTIEMTPASVEIKSPTVKIQGATMTQVEGATTKVTGAAMLQLQGAIIKVN